MTLPPYLKFRTSDPRHREAFADFLLGTYQSPWSFLVDATLSNLRHGAKVTCKLNQMYRKNVARGQRPAETWLIMNINYSKELTGPLLGTILCAAAAIEAFLRMSMLCSLERDLPKRTRARGTPESVVRKLGRFDELPFHEKLDKVFDSVLGRKCKRALYRDVRDLAWFRNSCFHTDPVLFGWCGDEGIKRGKRSKIPLRRRVPHEYPLLWRDERPLSLTAAIRAARTHDAVARELSSDPFLASALRDRDLLLNKDPARAIEAGLEKIITLKDFDEMAREWDEVVEKGLLEVCEEDKRLLALELHRKANVGPVKPRSR